MRENQWTVGGQKTRSSRVVVFDLVTLMRIFEVSWTRDTIEKK